MHFEASLVVRAPRCKTYQAYTDFETMPKWSRQVKTVTATKKAGRVVVVEVTSESGKKACREMKLYPPERVESEGEARFTRSKNVVTFDEAGEGTKVTASLDIRFKGRWGWFLKTGRKSEAEEAAMEELASFARYAEGLP